MIVLAVSLLATSVAATQPPADRIASALEDFATHCRADAGALWGISLCGGVLVADFDADRLYASDPDPAGGLSKSGRLHTGPLPSDLPRANTAVDWRGRRWIQLMWPLPEDDNERLRLLLHEAFHRIQPELGMTSRERDNEHLDGANGRLWMRLEWRALAAALTAADWRPAVADALAFRQHRYRLIDSARAAEWALESNEGLAEYTGVRLAYGEAAAERAAAALREADGWERLARRFAYASGPAWGLLLDRLAPDWRRRVLSGANFSQLAAAAMGGAGALDHEALRRRAAHHGLAEVEAQEEELARTREAERARLEALLLGPDALVLPLAEAQMSFDPRSVTALPSRGRVYAGLTLSDRWGRIEVSGPALISSDFSVLRVSPVIAAAGNRLTGADWELTLNSRWEYSQGRVAPRVSGR